MMPQLFLFGQLDRRDEHVASAARDNVMKSKLATTVIGLLMLCAIQRASATTILDTIQGLPYDTGAPGGWDFSNSGGGHGQSLGLEFVLASPTAITGVEAYVFSQFANGRANFGIMADAGGVPSGSFIT